MEWRDWLIVLGVLVLVGVAADAWRRIRNRNRLQLKIDSKFKDLPEYASDELGEVRVVGRAQAMPQEPSFSDADITLSDDDNRREPSLQEPPRRAAAAAHDDLLLADSFQGVGQGAGDFLGPLGEPAAAQEPPAAVDRPGVRRDEDRGDLGDDGVLGPARVVSRAAVSPRQAPPAEPPLQPEPLDAADAVTEPALDAALQPVAEPLAERAGQVPPAAAEAPEVSAPAEPRAIAQDHSATASETQAEDQTAAAASPESVALGLVAASEAGLDLSRPIPELLAEQARRTEQQGGAEPASDAVADDEVALPAGAAAATDALNQAASAAPAVAAEAHPAATCAEATSEATPEATTPEPAAPAKSARERRRHPRPEVQTTFFEHFPDLAPEPAGSAAAKGRKSGASPAPRKAKSKAEELPAPDEVLVITVMAKHEPFSGRQLFKLVEACGLTFGKMSIFHRHEQADGEGPVQFSMVNAVHPGIFEPQSAGDFATPGVTFFLTMSEPSKLMEAFDCMLATAQCVADNLEGELRDEHRSSLRSQTIEHYRHKIRDFERRRLARRA